MQLCVISIVITDGVADQVTIFVAEVFPVLNLSAGTEEVVELVLIGVPSKFFKLEYQVS